MRLCSHQQTHKAPYILCHDASASNIEARAHFALLVAVRPIVATVDSVHSGSRCPSLFAIARYPWAVFKKYQVQIKKPKWVKDGHDVRRTSRFVGILFRLILLYRSCIIWPEMWTNLHSAATTFPTPSPRLYPFFLQWFYFVPLNFRTTSLLRFRGWRSSCIFGNRLPYGWTGHPWLVWWPLLRCRRYLACHPRNGWIGVEIFDILGGTRWTSRAECHDSHNVHFNISVVVAPKEPLRLLICIPYPNLVEHLSNISADCDGLLQCTWPF